MIPQGTWAPGFQPVEPYPVFNAVLPEERPRISAVSIGPDALNAANGSLTNRYWMVSQTETGAVVIQTTP